MKRYILLSLFFILISVYLVGCKKEVETNPKIIKLEELFDNYSKDDYFSGTVLIVEDNNTLIENAYGMADNEKHIENSIDSIYRIGSISKQFTAMCILILEERGLLNTSDTLDQYISDFPNGDKITIHNLLTQTSGIPEYITLETLTAATHAFTPMEIINSFKDEPLEFEPNRKFKYSNSNYILLGYIIEKVSGKKYDEFVEENILTPLEMHHTSYDHNEPVEKRAVGYTVQEGALEEAPYVDMSFAYSAGALQSTVKDLYKWDQALYTEKLVTKASLNKMFTPFRSNYAYGWFIGYLYHPSVMFHGGNINGFTTMFYRDTELNRVIIILTNRDQYHNILKLLKDVIVILDAQEE